MKNINSTESAMNGDRAERQRKVTVQDIAWTGMNQAHRQGEEASIFDSSLMLDVPVDALWHTAWLKFSDTTVRT